MYFEWISIVSKFAKIQEILKFWKFKCGFRSFRNSRKFEKFLNFGNLNVDFKRISIVLKFDFPSNILFSFFSFSFRSTVSLFEIFVASSNCVKASSYSSSTITINFRNDGPKQRRSYFYSFIFFFNCFIRYIIVYTG